MTLRWQEEQPGKSLYVFSGRHRIGMIVRRDGDGRHVWMIDAVQGSKYLSATRGERRDLDGARRALREAWRRWLAERALQEIDACRS